VILVEGLLLTVLVFGRMLFVFVVNLPGTDKLIIINTEYMCMKVLFLFACVLACASCLLITSYTFFGV